MLFCFVQFFPVSRIIVHWNHKNHKKMQVSESLSNQKRIVWTVIENSVIKTLLIKFLTLWPILPLFANFATFAIHHFKYSHMGTLMKYFDEKNSLVHIKVFWKSVGVLNRDYCRHSLSNVIFMKKNHTFSHNKNFASCCFTSVG